VTVVAEVRVTVVRAPHGEFCAALSDTERGEWRAASAEVLGDVPALIAEHLKET
jgi:hypothetical protein